MVGRWDFRQDQITELQRGVRNLDRLLSRLSGNTTDSARSVTDTARNALSRHGETAMDAFGDVSERFREGAERVGREAARLGHRAAAVGEVSLDRFVKQVGLHPILFVGAILGVGAIIGAARYRYAVEGSSRRPRSQARKGNRK